MNAARPEPPDSTRFDDLSPQQMVDINRLCDLFEQRWDGGRPDLLESFLSTVPDSLRDAALPELVAIDLECRTRRGLAVEADDYLRRFPELSRPWVDRQFEVLTDIGNANNEPEIPVPDSIGDYQLREELGRGGMGRVFKGVHRLMGRVVAIKVLHPSISRQSAAQRRFEREVRAVASLTHANIVAALDAREDNGILYLVSEYVDGIDLSRAIRRKGPLKPRVAVSYVLQAAQGLKYAHEQGLVHRDIKPGNLLVDRKGVVKILDLGLARWRSLDDSTEREASLTRTEHIIGTVNYMSPEQARAPQSVDGRSDIYSLGCTLYFLLTGKPPYSGTGPIDTLLAHANDPVPAIQIDGVPPELERLMSQMLAKNPNERPADMRALIAGLKSIQEILKDPDSTRATALYGNTAFESPLFPPVLLPASPPNGKKTPRSEKRIPFLMGKRMTVAAFIVAGMLTVLAAALLVNALKPQLVSKESFEQNSSLEQPGRMIPDGAKSSPGFAEEQSSSAGSAPSEDAEPRNQPSVAETGVRFNGISSYLQADEFDVPFTGPAMIEAIATAGWQRGPANLVTWSGPQLIALFRSSDQVWGIAVYEGERSRLVTTETPLPVGKETLIAGSWDGRQLRLFVDGREVATKPTEYALGPGPLGLFVGGIPEQFLPPHQGTRYFAGSIRAVRVSQGELPAPARNLEELMVATDTTVALLATDSSSPNRIRDFSTHQWPVRLFNVR